MLAALAASLSAAPALATQGMLCASVDGDASIELLLGSAGGLGFAGGSMNAGDRSWVTDAVYGDGEIFTFGQGMSDLSGIRIDFFDDIVNERVAELRLSRAEEGDEIVLAGTLRIVDVGVWAVFCEEQ